MSTTMKTMKTRTAATVLVAAILMIAAAAHACPPGAKAQADQAFNVARGFISQKNWQEAVPALRSALGICPDHINSLRYLGKSYMGLGQFDKAVEQFDLLIEAQGANVTANDLMDLGKAYTKLKQYREARVSYIKAARLDPENCRILFNLAVLHAATKNYPDAVDVYERVVENCADLESKVMPKLATACEKAAIRAEQKGDLQSAEIYRRKQAEFGRGAGGSTAYKLITDKMKVQDWAGATQECNNFLAANPGSAYEDKVLLNLARCYVELGQVSNAAATYAKYIDIKPADGKVAEEYVELLTKNEQCEQALSVAQSAVGRITETEGLVWAHYGLGKALECAGRYNEARDEFQYCVNNGTGDIRDWARTEVGRQEQLEERRRMQRQNAGR